MIINILNNGKILKNNLGVSLPDFTVLTGENGSGKTQLLESIRDNAQGYWEHQETQNMNDPETHHEMIFPVLNDEKQPLHDIVYSSPGLMNYYQEINTQQPLINRIKEQWTSLEPITTAYHRIGDRKFDNYDSEISALNNTISTFFNSIIADNRSYSRPKFKEINKVQLKQLKDLSAKASKKIADIKFIDYLIFYDVPTNVFSSAIDLLFHQFHLKKKYYPNLTENITPPWDVFNSILEKAEFKYRAEYNPSNNEEYPQPVKLINNNKDINNVSLNSLSSGEKTIMALIFVMYHASSNGKFPEVLLFDEPDAHLHPSLTQMFLSVIQDVLIDQQKVKVILSTHSPSTIALSSAKSIYRMDGELGCPVAENIHDAVRSLSDGMVTVTQDEGNLEITYNLRKTSKHIVFTEGITDKIILEIAWSKLYPTEEMPFFIQDAFSANFLGTLFNQGDQTPDGIFTQFPNRKLIALFDFDKEGYGNWNREKKFPKVLESDPAKCLTRSNEHNGYLILLPSTKDEEINKLVLINSQETFKDKSNLTIESLFLGVPHLREKYFREQTVLGGGTIYTFDGKKGGKRIFANSLRDLDNTSFLEFTAIFDKISDIIKL